MAFAEVYRKALIPILQIHSHSQPELLAVAQATCLSGFLSGSGKHWEQDPGQDPNDGNHHEQFDQGEAPVSGLVFHSLNSLLSLRSKILSGFFSLFFLQLSLGLK